MKKTPGRPQLRDDPLKMPSVRSVPHDRVDSRRRRHLDLVGAFCLSALMGVACQRGEAGDGSSAPAAGDPAEPGSQGADPEAQRDPLDRAISQMWQRAKVEAAPEVDDAGFLRRVTLDLTGRIPTDDEVRTFVDDASAEKRAQRVDALLGSQEYAAYWSEVYAGLLLGNDKIQPRSREQFETWLEGGLAAGRGWDAMASEMVTATGDASKNPAGIFMVSHLRQAGPELLTGALTRKMLGVQIECAQCHDHPYSDFTREDFYGMAAFFTRTRVQRSDKKDKAKAADMEAMAKPANVAKGAKRSFTISDRGRGEMRIKPKDDEGNEADRKVKIAPAFLGQAIALKPADARRPVFATQMVSSDLFSQAAVGFVWTELFGRGISDPWDELGDASRERAPALTVLAKEFEAQGYDLRWLLRRIVLSQAYQRSAAGPAMEASAREDAERVFARAAVRPMRSEQLFRSLLEATGLEDVGGREFRRAVKSKKQQALAEYDFIFADDEGQHIDAFSGNVPQALLLLNGGLTNQGALRHPGSTLDKVLNEEGFEARLETLYLKVYGRSPSEQEQKQARGWTQGQGAQAWEDLLFAMLNSTEFTTNH